MKYCVIKNTTTVIDGSENSFEIMMENVRSAGLSEDVVEILTDEEYKARKALEPVASQQTSIENYLLDLDFRLSVIELGLQ